MQPYCDGDDDDDDGDDGDDDDDDDGDGDGDDGDGDDDDDGDGDDGDDGDDDGDDDDDDDDPVELFQTRGKWWELIVYLQYDSYNLINWIYIYIYSPNISVKNRGLSCTKQWKFRPAACDAEDSARWSGSRSSTVACTSSTRGRTLGPLWIWHRLKHLLAGKPAGKPTSNVMWVKQSPGSHHHQELWYI